MGAPTRPRSARYSRRAGAWRGLGARRSAAGVATALAGLAAARWPRRAGIICAGCTQSLAALWPARMRVQRASAVLRALAIDMPARHVRFWTQRLATGLRNVCVASAPITMLVYSSLRGAVGLSQACGSLEPPPCTSRAHLRQFISSVKTQWHAHRVQLDALGGKRFGYGVHFLRELWPLPPVGSFDPAFFNAPLFRALYASPQVFDPAAATSTSSSTLPIKNYARPTRGSRLATRESSPLF